MLVLGGCFGGRALGCWVLHLNSKTLQTCISLFPVSLGDSCSLGPCGVKWKAPGKLQRCALNTPFAGFLHDAAQLKTALYVGVCNELGPVRRVQHPLGCCCSEEHWPPSASLSWGIKSCLRKVVKESSSLHGSGVIQALSKSVEKLEPFPCRGVWSPPLGVLKGKYCLGVC